MHINRANIAFFVMIALGGVVWAKIAIQLLHDYFNFNRLATLTHFCPLYLHGLAGVHDSISVVFQIIIASCMVFTICRMGFEIRNSYDMDRYVNNSKNKVWSHYMNARFRIWNIPIYVIENDEKYTYTYGFLHSKIVISTGLLVQLDEDTLNAVMLRHYCHCSSRNPLKSLIAWFIKGSLPFIPINHAIFHYLRIWMELRADEFVLKIMPNRKTGVKTALFYCDSPVQALPYRVEHLYKSCSVVKVPVWTTGSVLISIIMTSLLIFSMTSC